MPASNKGPALVERSTESNRESRDLPSPIQGALQEIWTVRVGREGPGDRREGHVRRRGPRGDHRAVRARARGEARPGLIARVEVSKDYLNE